MSDYPQLNFDDNKIFNAAVLNAAMDVLDTRLRALESQTASYTDAVDQLNAFGLQRLNDAIQPVYNKLIAIAQIGVIFNATSNTPNALEVGQKTFIIDSARASTFAPAAYLQISSSSDGSMALYGATQTYDASTGTLVVLIDQLRGVSATPISAWNISAAGTPNLITQAHDVGAYSSVETDAAINTAISKIVGSPPASLNTLELLASAVTGFTAGAPANLKTFTQIATALDNRLRTDVAQGLSASAIAQALQNLGISSVMQSFLAGSGTLNSGLSVNGNLSATGSGSIGGGMTLGGTVQITQSGAAGVRMIVPGNADWLVRSIGGNRMQFCDGPATVEYLSFGTDGSISTRQFGDLNNRIESRASAYANGAQTNAINACVSTARFVYAGDLGNDWNYTGGFGSPYGGYGCVVDRSTSPQPGVGGQLISALRWRYLQLYRPNAGYFTIGAAS